VHAIFAFPFSGQVPEMISERPFAALMTIGFVTIRGNNVTIAEEK